MATKTELLKKIRIFCGECMGLETRTFPRGEVAQLIEECTAQRCVWYPYRFGVDPDRKKVSRTFLEASKETRFGGKKHRPKNNFYKGDEQP